MKKSRESDGMDYNQVIEDLTAETPPCEIRPREFFIAWHGVPVLAFHGFPPGLMTLKKKIAEKLPSLVPENSGSLWPKVSLGARRAGSTARDISRGTLETLRDICDEANYRLRDAPAWLVKQLQVVVYSRRGLEQTISRRRMNLASASLNPSFLNPSSEPADPDGRGNVDQVLGEFARENLEQYLPHVSRAGRNIDYYREDFQGTTLAHVPLEIPDYIRAFRRDIDRELPGLYEWFQDDSLHVTLRALSGG